jgi:putative hemolysin
MSDIQQVHIRKVFAAKNPKLAKLIPGFLFSLIENIVHQEEINYYLNKFGHLYGVPFVEGSLEELGTTIKLVGVENLPANRRAVFISNHPLGGLDGLVLMKLIGNHYGDVRVIINDILMNVRNLAQVFIPVNKVGANSKEYAKMMDEAFESDIPLVTFPAGMCSRKIKGKIIDLEWKKSFLQKAIAHQRDIIPIYTNGRNSEFFYNLANFRKKIGIKANIEMFLLVHELYSQYDKTICCTVGKPVSWQLLKTMPIKEALSSLRENVYALENNPHADFKTHL